MAARFAAKTVLAAFSIAGAAAAAEPELKHLYPLAGAPGTTVAVAAVGKIDVWPPQVWVSSPGITFTPTPVTGVFSVETAPDAPLGPHLVRFFNGEGASAPRYFIVSQEPDLREAEPNDHFGTPQTVEGLPAIINGRLDKAGDVDSYAVTLRAGQTLIASLEGYLLASPFDGMLRIVDGQGAQYTFNHDSRTPDPFLAWEAPHDGTFVVQVMGFVLPATAAVQFTGGEACIYRLHLTSEAVVRYTIPLAVQRGKEAPVQLVGWNFKAAVAEIDSAHVAAPAGTAAITIPGAATNHLLAISDIPEATENEPNNSRDEANTLGVPGAITARIQESGDQDRFTFTAVKKRIYDLTLTGAQEGSPLDAWLAIENKDGKEIARNDDAAGSRDPQLIWTAPADGAFTVAIGELTHRGGEDFIYRLAVTEAAPSVAGTAADHSLKLQPGKDGELKIAIKRAHGFKAKLRLKAKGLPAGVSAAEVDVPEKDGDVALKFTAEDKAEPANQPLRLVLCETESEVEYPIRHVMTATSLNNGVPQGFSDLLIGSTEDLWLTVLPASEKPDGK